MQYVADLQCNTCFERWPIRRRNIIRKPCPYCQSSDTRLVKTYGPISDKEQNIPMWCVNCEQRKDATSWRQACDTCQCGGTRVPTYLLPQFSHDRPVDVPHTSAVPWTKDSVVKKIAVLDFPQIAPSRTQKVPLTKQLKNAAIEGFRKGFNSI